MFQIIFNKENNRWEIMDTSDYYIESDNTFHEYKFETEVDARGVYIHHVLQKTDGFSLEYIQKEEE